MLHSHILPKCYLLWILSWWRHLMETFSSLLGPGPVNSLHKGQWCGAVWMPSGCWNYQALFAISITCSRQLYLHYQCTKIMQSCAPFGLVFTHAANSWNTVIFHIISQLVQLSFWIVNFVTDQIQLFKMCIWAQTRCVPFWIQIIIQWDVITKVTTSLFFNEILLWVSMRLSHHSCRHWLNDDKE